MIEAGQIRDAINQLLVDQLHANTVYINRCPQNFDRPSYWLETVRIETSDVNISTVKVNAYFLVTCFTAVDEYGNSDSRELTDVQDSVVKLFRCGFVWVEDRALKVKAMPAGFDNDRSYVDLQFEFFDDRSDDGEDDTPLMEDLDFDF